MSLEKTTIGTFESTVALRGAVSGDREALRIPGPPPVPSPVPSPSSTSSSPRRRTSTNPGVGLRAGEAPPAAPRPSSSPPPRRTPPPSLSSTQVGLGAVRLDASGNVSMAKPVSEERRYLVRAGDRKGELILTALPEGVVPPSTVMTVRLRIDREDDARAIGQYVE